ncbi:SDR family oxidoreductase [Piscinibacter sp.]|jgi:uncharacterized protein YbjT (DUF2867 family)|uniref:SDR family oxidoreductase n=1 Tax=Piscinibacter sp. TaxID=1903157 RepID=UPI00355ABDD5
MRVLVCGSTGCVGSAVVHALRSRGHQVVEGARGVPNARSTLHIDFTVACEPHAWAERLRAAQVEAIVNCVGILMPSRTQSFERVHTRGPIELFRGAALAGVRRVLQVSALGVDGDAESLSMPYLHGKLLADDALAASPLDWAVLRPSLIYGPRSQSAALFATLASLPLISLPGRGAQRLQPIHVYELAEAITRLIEQPGELRAVYELGGPTVLSYREMLAHYRAALGCGAALWLPLPLPLMRLLAWVSQALPQKVFCRDTIRLLEHGSVPASNASAALLGRAPTAMAQGLAITPPEPLIDLRARLSPALSLALRASLAFMWLATAFISACWPDESGVLRLLARCGFEGSLGVAVMVASCSLNLAMGVLVLLRPSPWVYALQCAAVIGYTVTAAVNMPQLAIDHCGPLLKNLPVLATLLLLWMAQPMPSARRPARAERAGRLMSRRSAA